MADPTPPKFTHRIMLPNLPPPGRLFWLRRLLFRVRLGWSLRRVLLDDIRRLMSERRR